jgi:hypothetical protein
VTKRAWWEEADRTRGGRAVDWDEPPVSCPPSAVHDMIVTWDEVRDGDLVLNFRGELGVATVLPQGHAWCPEGRASVCIDGQWFTPRKDRLTAVRRYDTGKSA